MAGVVTDVAGKPVGHARVEIRNHDGSVPAGLGKPLVTSADGRFAWDSLVAGKRYLVVATAPGCAASVSEPTAARADELRVVVHPAKSLRGRTLDADAKPIAGASITLYLSPALIPLRATSDADGQFLLAPLGAAPGNLVAVRREVTNHVCEWKRVVRRAAVSSKDVDLVLAFDNGLSISGRAESANGEYVRRIVVQAVAEGTPADRSDELRDWCADRFAADGSFRIDGLTPGRYRLIGWNGDANGWSGPLAAQVLGTVIVEAGATDVKLKLVP